MVKLVLILSIFIQISWAKESNYDKIKSIKKLERLVFASCNKQNKPQPLWKEIEHQNPDLFIWGGDVVYGDGKGIGHLLASFNHQAKQPDYQKFKNIFPIIGTWDDHDFGKNNGGYNFEFKAQAQNYFLDFVEEPSNSSRRQQEGIYTSYTFGEKPHKTRIVLLDNRYFNGSEKDSLLGPKQWDWFKKELSDSDISLFLIVSGISVLSPKTIHSEEWADFPNEKLKLKNLLQETKRPYLYLAGDKHFADIYYLDSELEFLSSGMTHNSEKIVRPWIRSQYPNPVFKKNYGMVEISWKNQVPQLNLVIKGEKNSTYLQKKVTWKDTKWIEI